MGKIVLACQTTELKWSVAWRAVGLGGKAGGPAGAQKRERGPGRVGRAGPRRCSCHRHQLWTRLSRAREGPPFQIPRGAWALCWVGFHRDGSSLPQHLGAGFNLPLETNRGKESQHLTCGHRALRGRVQTVQTGSAPETSSAHPQLLRCPLPSHTLPVSVFLSQYFPSICVDDSLKPLSLWPSE